jgi:salicylate hydroxylase
LIGDAYVLSSLLGHCSSSSNPPAAFKAYDCVRVPRTCKVTVTSREQGNLSCSESPEAGSDLKKIDERLDREERLWMWNLDVEGHCKKAQGKSEEGRRAG